MRVLKVIELCEQDLKNLRELGHLDEDTVIAGNSGIIRMVYKYKTGKKK